MKYGHFATREKCPKLQVWAQFYIILFETVLTQSFKSKMSAVDQITEYVWSRKEGRLIVKWIR